MTEREITPNDPDARESWHAILIGVDRYPGLDARFQLGGCVNDAIALCRFLLDRVHVPEANVRLLLSPCSPAPLGDATPSAVRSADRETILAAFEELRQAARRGAHVVIAYSGHGVRFENNRTRERVYGFAASDVARVGGVHANLILDRELNTFLWDLTAAGATATVIADTCHAGGSTRAMDEPGAVRALPIEPEEARLSDGEWERLLGLYPGAPRRRAMSRGVEGSNGWLDDGGIDRDWVVLSACRDVETAKEDHLGPDRHGLLTACLLRELMKVPPELSRSLRWMDFCSNLRRSVVQRAWELRNGDQTPVLEGRQEKTVFGGEWEPFEPGFTARRGAVQGQIVLEGGAIDGLDEGAVIGVYPPETRCFEDAEAAGITVRSARIEGATPTTSTARLLDAGETIADGSRARVLEPSPVVPRIGVVLTDVPAAIAGGIEGVRDAAALLVLNPGKTRLDVEVRPWPQEIPAMSERPPAWVGTSGGWVIVPYVPDRSETTKDDVIAYLPSPAALGAEGREPEIGDALGRGLVHWARYLQILYRAHSDPTLQGLLDVALRAGTDRSDATRCRRHMPGPTGVHEVMEGEALWVELTVKGRVPGRLFAGMVACSNDGNTIRMWPGPGGDPTLEEGQVLYIGKDRRHAATPTIRPDQTSSLYTFKIIAATMAEGEPPPVLAGLLLDPCVQEVIDAWLPVNGSRKGGLGAPEPTGQRWCSWDLRVRVRRALRLPPKIEN